MERILKIGAATVNQTPLDWENNISNILDAISDARSQKVDLLCLPELTITGYGCEDLFLSNWVSETAIGYLPEIARHCQGITVIVGLPIWYKNKNYNCATVISDSKIIGINVKQFLALDGIHYEPRWFTAWDAGKLEEIEISGHPIPFGDFQFHMKGDILCGMEICEDAWRSNRPACRLKEKGVRIILNPSASHFAIGKSIRRKKLVQDSSATFQTTYVYANLLGNESGRIIYDGELLIAQQGRLIQQNRHLSFRKTNLVTANINIDNPRLSSADLDWVNLDQNEEFTSAVTLALYDYLRKSKNKGFVLSLSGGADSSSVAVLVSEMTRRGMDQLGIETFLKRIGRNDLLNGIRGLNEDNAWKFVNRELLTCVYQSTKNSSRETRLSAKTLAESIGSTYYEWDIDAEVRGYSEKIETAIGRSLTWETDDLALQNIQARSRSPIIWMLANIKGAILLTTSNRSEGDVGYATMDGDTSGSLAPIAGKDKYFIINWLKWAEIHLGYAGLHHVNSLTPTAELRPQERNQTDESDLMPYKILVEIERLAIYRHLSPSAVFEHLKGKNLADAHDLKKYIIKFYQLWSRNQWKRERLAPAFHLDDFNVDPRTWCRFPILSGGYLNELKELDKLKDD